MKTTINDTVLHIEKYNLTSFGDVYDVVDSVLMIKSDNLLIHIVSFIHNTVLVQKLKAEIEKKIPDAKLVMLKHSDKSSTSLNVYSIEKSLSNKKNISDIVACNLNSQYLKTTDDLKKCKKQLLSRFFCDHLTNLPNLYQLREDLHDKEDFGLVTIAIDDFGTINNFYGFMIGDFVIEKVGEFLINNIDEKIYRVGGTEFTFFLNKNFNFYELKEYLSQLYARIKNINIAYQRDEISVSLTIASCANSNHDNLFSKVSMAMKYAKNNGLPFWIYEDRMGFEKEYEENLDISKVVRYAVEHKKIVPYYQPIIHNQTEEITRYECLARLLDKDDNIISPAQFIPIAKRIKVYHHVTTIIIDKSFEMFENNEYEFSINLSMEDIISTQMYEYILQKLKTSKASNRVVFEIVESEAIQDFTKVEKFINEIRRYGAKIAIDDFGDGYSNFSYLIKMNVDYIKIDGSLIKDIDTDKNAFLVVETIVDFAKKLGIKTIAEFVHSSTVMARVKKLGIDYSQGYHIDKPLLSIG